MFTYRNIGLATHTVVLVTNKGCHMRDIGGTQGEAHVL